MKTKLFPVVFLALAASLPLLARPRPALPPVPEFSLNHWRFDQTNWWTVPRMVAEVVNAALVESWSGYATRLSAEGGALRLPAVHAGGRVNLDLE
jgi:hypothetical protein